MNTNLQTKKALAAYCELHHIPVPAWTPTETWGSGARTMAWRVSTHAGLHPSDLKTEALCALLFPPDVHARFRERLIKAYDGLVGVKEGSAKQQEIAAFSHIPASAPWCAAGAWYCAKHEALYNGPAPENTAYVPTWELFAKKYGLLVPDSLAAPGMLVTFVWDMAKYAGSGDHIGMVRATGPWGHVMDTILTTDEATAGGPGGDAVRRETRSWSVVNCIIDLARLQK